jgi:hypothetical protein
MGSACIEIDAHLSGGRDADTVAIIDHDCEAPASATSLRRDRSLDLWMFLAELRRAHIV